MDLTAAFTAPLLFNVLHGRETIGQVHPLSLTSPDGGPVTLSLGGRGYRLVGVDWPRRAAWVEPTGERGKSRWLGTSPALPFALCREALRVLVMGNICGATPSRRALEHLAELREELAFCEEGATAVVQDSQGRVRWWTFAGLAANAALVAALGAHGSARPENFAIAFNAGDARAIVGRIRCIDPLSPSPPPFVDEDAVERSLKFAECLPPDLAHAILRARMTDLDGARRILEMPVKTVGTK
jgi:ATP-dependent Lhr-like helicase